MNKWDYFWIGVLVGAIGVVGLAVAFMATL